ncbi:MAG TPA: bifunctional phosphopantothenoylcysteine decarboxylase/phosphopantothenate--cysteine ligase CoaBC [Chitinophagales bacterium]|nr:bifunctional phosphopantothenoylcysteine decarboxylase/phosphopantothenate--cysteine ligase CoaBC [Chitinophagales bacterium]
MSALSGKKILLGVTGSIAAYKSALLIRLLVKEGAEVKVLMTKSAMDFITPLTLSTLSKNKVLSDLVDDKETLWNNHVELGLWADVMIVAPASANTIAKFAHGICDNILSAVYLSARCPVCVAPAMDEDMWKHTATQQNISALQLFGNHIIQVESGELASGLTGEGRMAEPETILAFIKNLVEKKTSSQKKRLKGKKAVVTAGPTHEAIDPVRFIGNHSSGKMGIAIAEKLADEGADVQLVLGPSSLAPKHASIKTTAVTSANEMFAATMKSFKKADIAVMSAAVADYTPENFSLEKIKKHNGKTLNLPLKQTPDILKALGKKKHNGQILVGFALETNDEMKHAKEKLRKKNLDFIVLNSLNDEGAGFQHDTNRITIIDRKKKIYPFELKSKQDVAKDIVEFIVKKIEDRR